MKVVYIEWIDAVASVGWEKQSIPHSPDLCQAIGFLIHEDKTGITLAATVSKEESNSRITIPKGWIKSRKVIKI